MKRIAVIFAIVLMGMNVYGVYEVPVTDTSAATIAARAGINIDTSGITIRNGTVGINGLALRFLDDKGTGFEVPVGFTYNYAYDNGNYFPYSFNGSISSGFKFIFSHINNEFFKINTLTGITASYTAKYSNYDNSSAKDTYFFYNISVAAVEGFEVEVFISKFFSLPYHSLAIATGLNLSLGGSFGETTDVYEDKTNSAYNTKKYSKQVGSTGTFTSFGTTLSSIGIRVYY